MTFTRLSTTAALLALPAVLLSCAGSTTTQRTNPEDNLQGEGSYSTKTSIFTDKDDAALDVARGLRRDGRYDEAAEAFRALHEDTSVKPDVREKALFDRAHMTADLLNPGKDTAAAIALFERFLAEFPASEQADRAREQLDVLRSRPPGP
jgi:hypothetical protein